MPTKEESEAAAALTEFWTGVKRDQPEIEWHLESTKMMVALSPVEYEGKQYTPGELFYPASGRARMLVAQRLGQLVFVAQRTRNKGEIIPLENLSRPPASFEGMPIDCGTIEVYFPNYRPESYHYGRGATLKVPAFQPWPDIIEETGAEFKPYDWEQFVRCRVLTDTDLLRAFVPLPWPWPLSSESYQFFLNKPTVHKLGYQIEGIPSFTFGDPAGALLCFNPQIPGNGQKPEM